VAGTKNTVNVYYIYITKSLVAQTAAFDDCANSSSHVQFCTCNNVHTEQAVDVYIILKQTNCLPAVAWWHCWMIWTDSLSLSLAGMSACITHWCMWSVNQCANGWLHLEKWLIRASLYSASLALACNADYTHTVKIISHFVCWASILIV